MADIIIGILAIITISALLFHFEPEMQDWLDNQ